MAAHDCRPAIVRGQEIRKWRWLIAENFPGGKELSGLPIACGIGGDMELLGRHRCERQGDGDISVAREARPIEIQPAPTPGILPKSPSVKNKNPKNF